MDGDVAEEMEQRLELEAASGLDRLAAAVQVSLEVGAQDDGVVAGADKVRVAGSNPVVRSK